MWQTYKGESLTIDQTPRQQCLQAVLEGMRYNHKPGYTVKFPSPWWTLGVPTSAHINKLMIIAKGENHTLNIKTSRKGKLEWKRFYHSIAYNLKVQDI